MKRHLTSLSILSISSLLTLTCWFGMPSQAEIPFEQIKGIYSASKKGQEANSPLWGMVALKTEILPHLRFFGNYGTYNKETDLFKDEQQMKDHLRLLRLWVEPKDLNNLQGFEKKWEGVTDVPQDAISALIQLLFPSPDGAIFVANELSENPLKDLIKGKNDTIDLTKFNELLQMIVTLQTKEKPDWDDLRNKFEKLFLGNKKIKKIDDLNLKTNNRDKASFMQLHLIDILVSGLQQEREQNPKTSLYPQNIVMTSLMAYAWKIGNSKSDLAPLKAVIDPNKMDDSAYTTEDYFKNKDVFVGDLQNENEMSPTEIAFYREGYAAYEEVVPSLISYKKNVKSFEEKIKTYPDCGETSLRNFFYIVFTDHGSFNPKQFSTFVKEKLGKTDWEEPEIKDTSKINVEEGKDLLSQLYLYFSKYPSTSVAGTDAAHEAWGKIVSNLNEKIKKKGEEGLESCPVSYGAYSKCSACEVDAGLTNMLNVIANLTGDKQLNETWKEKETDKLKQAASKLTRLCELVSRDNFKLEWDIQDKLEVPGNTNVKITFAINGKNAFYWNFLPMHFEINKVVTSGWPSKISWDNSNFKNYPLLQAWFVKLTNLENSEYQKSAESFFVYAQDLKNNDVVIKIADYLFDKMDTNFYPLIVSWLRSSFNDEHSREQLKAMMIGHPDQLKLFSDEEQKKLKVKEGEARDLLFKYIVKYGYLSSLRELIKQDKNFVNAEDKHGRTLLHLAATSGHTNVAALLIEDGAEVDAEDTDERTPLHLAATSGHTNVAALLIEEGAEVDAKDEDGRTPLHLAVMFGGKDMAALLIEKKADVYAKDEDNETPLHLAAKIGKKDVAALLIEEGARVTQKDINVAKNEEIKKLLTEAMKKQQEQKKE